MSVTYGSRVAVGWSLPKAEEITNLLLTGLVGNSLDVNCGRHDDDDDEGEELVSFGWNELVWCDLELVRVSSTVECDFLSLVCCGP